MDKKELEKAAFSNEEHAESGKLLRDVILGGQDGLVNVLGILLGIAVATNDSKLVILAGLAATFAESISMAAVAYTSTKAAAEYYEKERQREVREMNEVPDVEEYEIKEIYSKKGFVGKDLDFIVKKICANKQIWLEVMMSEELKLDKPEGNPKKNALVVGGSAIVGSLIPLLPFFVFPAKDAMLASLVFSTIVLFVAGAYKSKFTVIGWKRSGLELAAIGILSALAGYAIGSLFGAPAG
jgi:VIT1/CCC1 family predicted Fe2+/Mn2+ transporter